MRGNSTSSNEFISDFSAIEGTSTDRARMTLYTLKNIVCHQVIEQYIKDKTLTSFRVNVAPIGYLTLYKDDKGNWSIKDLDISQMFMLSLNQALRSGESPLYAQHSDWANRFMKYQLNSIDEELQ